MNEQPTQDAIDDEQFNQLIEEYRSLSWDDRRKFYLDHFVEPVASKVRSKLLARLGWEEVPPVAGLLTIVGTQYMSALIQCHVWRPRRVFVLHTDMKKSRKATELLRQQLEQRIGEEIDFYQGSCDPNSSESIIAAVRSGLGRLKSALKDTDGDIRFDVTGGTGTMTAVVASFGWEHGLYTCHLPGEYDENLGQPLPGSQRIERLASPTEVFRDRRMRDIRMQIGEGSFVAARKNIARLKGEITSAPEPVRQLGHVCEMYSAWFDLDFKAASEQSEKLDEGDSLSRALPDESVRKRIFRHAQFLRKLKSDPPPIELLTSHFLQGEFYLNRGRLAFAVLLFYRTIEGCLQERLCSTPLFPSLVPDAIDWHALLNRTDRIREDGGFQEAYRRIMQSERGVPWNWPAVADGSYRPPLTLVQAATILCALDDDLARNSRLGKKMGNSTQRSDNNGSDHINIRSLAGTRNKSILAHGDSPVGEQDAKQFCNAARTILINLRALQEDDPAAESTVRSLRIEPLEEP